jgi:hypothetical protein
MSPGQHFPALDGREPMRDNCVDEGIGSLMAVDE